jgi:hypothetical protein
MVSSRFSGIQCDQPDLPPEKTLHGRAGVAEQHAPRAMQIEQVVQELPAGGGITGGHGFERGRQVGIVREQALEFGEVIATEFLAAGETRGEFGRRAVVGGLFRESFEITVAIRIEESQPGEVAFQAQLFRRGREQQQSVGPAAELFHQRVLGADRLRRPAEMMRFIHHEDIPLPGGDLRGAAGICAEKIDAREDQLIVEEGVRTGFARLDGGAAFFIEDVQPDVETAEHFDEPLMHERFRHQHEDAFRPAGEQQAVENQAGFDGLAEAHFVGEQDPGRVSRADGLGDVELMRNQIDAAPDEAAHA